MNRDPEADDAFVDHCLREELGGMRPPDLAERIAGAQPERLARAAAAVDAAAAARGRRRRRTVALAAAAVLAVAATAVWVGKLLVAPPLTVEQRAQALLDEFHRVMPQRPAMLRDEPRRREVAARAVPVVRAILDLHEHDPGERVFGARILEFEVYAAVLGDTGVLDALSARAAAGDPAAAAELATVGIAIGDGEARATALVQLGAALRQRPDIEQSIVQCLDVADLSRDEAERLSPAVSSPAVRRGLMLTAELAAASPRRLLGAPLELFGRLVDDRWFSTNTLHGRVVLVCFWASWCKPSRAVLDELRRVGAGHPELAVVCVSCDDDPAALRNYLEAHADREWIHFFDRTRPGWHEFALSCRVNTLPFVMMLDRQGIVRDVHCESELDAAVRRQLAR
ncbi:MAG TPA: TlpA disulfide reductase family protein [Planctomycetota bacterium]|nr:TlpA disulfide reductase family protein [Planctomycetota bacterium]